ncbi:hypothetical protein GCM10010206_48270 [Streptomyces cinerochromogenes]|nr:hypothetical protein GCM10010206_48270 [Streptomyces cinerochromogenes]
MLLSHRHAARSAGTAASVVHRRGLAVVLMRPVSHGCGGCPSGGGIPLPGMAGRSLTFSPWTTFSELPEERERCRAL